MRRRAGVLAPNLVSFHPFPMPKRRALHAKSTLRQVSAHIATVPTGGNWAPVYHKIAVFTSASNRNAWLNRSGESKKVLDDWVAHGATIGTAWKWAKTGNEVRVVLFEAMSEAGRPPCGEFAHCRVLVHLPGHRMLVWDPFTCSKSCPSMVRNVKNAVMKRGVNEGMNDDQKCRMHCISKLWATTASDWENIYLSASPLK